MQDFGGVSPQHVQILKEGVPHLTATHSTNNCFKYLILSLSVFMSHCLTFTSCLLEQETETKASQTDSGTDDLLFSISLVIYQAFLLFFFLRKERGLTVGIMLSAHLVR